ncbi:MAG: heavy metal-binding domain-containing protein [Coriobacteriia bacterium]|nr:heavy metal-binding domain-containing protein [Coriobacteriia bacterium]
MIDPNSVLVVSAESVPGFRVAAMLGEVFGSTSQSSHGSIKALSTSLNPLSQGELVHFTKTVDAARLEAISRLKESAAVKGANAVIAMRFTIDSISELSITAVAYGTAVVLTKQ